VYSKNIPLQLKLISYAGKFAAELAPGLSFTNRRVGFQTPHRNADLGSKAEAHVAGRGPQSRGHWWESAFRRVSAQH
jgi:hypothetical protein